MEKQTSIVIKKDSIIKTLNYILNTDYGDNYEIAFNLLKNEIEYFKKCLEMGLEYRYK